MAGIKVEVNVSQLLAALDVLGAKRSGAAITRAVNRTATSVRRNVLRELSREIGLTQRKLSGNVRVDRARAIVARRKLQATAIVRAAGSDISVTEFGARPIGAGVSYSPGRKAKRKRVLSAFITRLRGGKTGVAVRATEAPNVLVDEVEKVRRRRRIRRGPTDIPIAKLVLPGVSQVMLDDSTQDQIEREGTETLGKNLDQQIRLELIRASKGAARSARRRR